MVVCRALLPVVVLVAALLSGAPVRSDEGSIELRVVGSGTLRALVESWGTRLGEGRPGIRVEVESGGSRAGPRSPA